MVPSVTVKEQWLVSLNSHKCINWHLYKRIFVGPLTNFYNKRSALISHLMFTSPLTSHFSLFLGTILLFLFHLLSSLYLIFWMCLSLSQRVTLRKMFYLDSCTSWSLHLQIKGKELYYIQITRSYMFLCKLIRKKEKGKRK